jgi:hypothetical protein
MTLSILQSDPASRTEELEVSPGPPAGPGDHAIYENLQARGGEAGRGGRFEEALPLLESAWRWAQDHGDAVLEDRAFVNWSAAAISLRRGTE